MLRLTNRRLWAPQPWLWSALSVDWLWPDPPVAQAQPPGLGAIDPAAGLIAVVNGGLVWPHGRRLARAPAAGNQWCRALVLGLIGLASVGWLWPAPPHQLTNM